MVIVASIVFAAAMASASPRATSLSLRTQVRRLLTDYSEKNAGAIVSMTDPDGVLMMGTAASEVAPSPGAMRSLLENDFRGWDTSHFGAFQRFYVRSSRDMASAFFDVPWTCTVRGTTRTYTLRIATVWHHSRAGWRLAQLLDAVAS